jgi:APA family basic amino acid/polyamine antiporter
MATKSVKSLQEQAEGSHMRRTLGAVELTLFGIGEIVGSGIFVLTGTAAADHAGPAVVVSFAIAVRLGLCLWCSTRSVRAELVVRAGDRFHVRCIVLR